MSKDKQEGCDCDEGYGYAIDCSRCEGSGTVIKATDGDKQDELKAWKCNGCNEACFAQIAGGVIKPDVCLYGFDDVNISWDEDDTRQEDAEVKKLRTIVEACIQTWKDIDRPMTAKSVEDDYKKALKEGN